MSLKQRTIRGFSWVFVDRFFNKLIQFVIGIILARLLTPEEYGLIGMTAVFLAISDTFIVTGFDEALVQKKEPTRADYSTIFVANILTACFFYGLFYWSAPLISSFFNEPRLEQIIVVINLVIIIKAFGMVPQVPLVRNLDFKLLALISVSATLISGIVAIAMAFHDFGVWSLVWRAVVMTLISTVLVNIFSRAPLGWQFSRASFRELFGFGANLMASRLIIEAYENLYYLVIGKYFSARDLGIYTKANGFKDLPSKTLHNLINSVSFPALSKIKDEEQRLKTAFRRLIQVTVFIAFVAMFGLAGAAENFVVGLIGEQWEDAVIYLQLLCLVGATYPLIHLNMSLWVVKGKSREYLRMEIIMKVMAIPIIVASIFLGITAMIVGLIVISLIHGYLALKVTARLIQYPVKEQIKDISPSLFTGASLGLFLLILGRLDVPHLAGLSIQGLAGLAFVVIVAGLSQLEPFLEIKKIVSDLVQSRLKKSVS